MNPTLQRENNFTPSVTFCIQDHSSLSPLFTSCSRLLSSLVRDCHSLSLFPFTHNGDHGRDGCESERFWRGQSREFEFDGQLWAIEKFAKTASPTTQSGLSQARYDIPGCLICHGQPSLRHTDWRCPLPLFWQLRSCSSLNIVYVPIITHGLQIT